jgi:cell wall-associated NlpC family hydrolase
MSVRHRLLLFFSLFLVFTFLVVASNSEAARITSKKAEATHRRKGVAVKKRPSRTVSRRDFSQRHSPLAEEYLVSELSPQENELLQKAYGLLGIKYRFGGSSYAGIDCSAFVKKVYASQNQPLPRTAREQYAAGIEVRPEELQKGDLLFFHTYADFPSHVGIYIGDGLMIHASSQGGRVMISRMDTPYLISRFLGARRISSDGGGFLGELARGAEPEKESI